MVNTILITTAINAVAGQTKLSNTIDRLNAVKVGVEKWLQLGNNVRFVICDGSGYSVDSLKRALVPAMYDDRFEILSFSNNFQAVERRGKGYGEGEIVKFAIENSKIIFETGEFVKCTGKLWVENFDKCRLCFDRNFSIDYSGLFSSRFLDTRFYHVTVDFYIKYLRDAHLNVQDCNGYYLEHAFRDAVSSFKLSEFVMSPTPRVLGVSGSMGTQYANSYVKPYLRDLRTSVVKLLDI